MTILKISRQMTTSAHTRPSAAKALATALARASSPTLARIETSSPRENIDDPLRKVIRERQSVCSNRTLLHSSTLTNFPHQARAGDRQARFPRVLRSATHHLAGARRNAVSVRFRIVDKGYENALYHSRWIHRRGPAHRVRCPASRRVSATLAVRFLAR